MRGLLIGLFVAAGCYQPAVRSGVPCSTQGECPDGQSCVAGFCSLYSATAPDAAPVGPADRDRDGVLDDRDNCPDASNAEQINEDGDRLGDACDSCPHLSDTASPDRDGDGLADACDPNPVGTRDSRWLFEGFHAGVPQWPASLNWAASGDADTIRVTAAGTGNTSEYLTLPLSSPGRTSFDNFTVSASLTIDQTSGGSPELGFFVGDTAANGELDCTLYPGHLGFYDPKADHSTLAAWQNGTPYTLTIARRGNVYTCSVAGPNLQQSATMTSLVVPNGASIGLFAYGATARIDWMFVAGSP